MMPFLVVSICVILLAVLLIAAVLSDKLRNVVISSEIYKQGFAVHMNIFSRIHNKAVHKRKQEMFMHMGTVLGNIGGGDVLEIGSGTGANFEYFPPGSSVIALDPNPHMEPYLLENAEKSTNVQLKGFVCGVAENMEGIADGTVAAVVCTLTLCSVQDMDAVLTEAKRVLKPGGYFYFLEHVADETQTWRHSFQRKFDNAWKYLSDGCSCNRDTWTSIDNAGFSSVHYQKFYLNELMLPCYLMRPHLAGYAIK